jgi:hypothetical protein
VSSQSDRYTIRASEPGRDVLDVRAVVTDEGDDERGTRELVEAGRGAGGWLGQRERRCGGARGRAWWTGWPCPPE